MTEEIIDFDLEEEEKSRFLQTARRVILASIGAIALAQDEAEAFINKLIERGEIAEQDGKKLLNEVMERRKKIQKKTEDEMSKQVESMLERMDVPTKADIDALSKKISSLSKQIDELSKKA